MTSYPTGSQLMAAEPSVAGVGGTVSYQTYSVPLYAAATGPSLGDINQGALGDCYFLAPLACIALNDKDFLKSLITDQGGGNYSVTFFVNNKAKVISVDSSLPTIHENGVMQVVNGKAVSGQSLVGNDAHSNMTSLWANLVEKAYAVLHGNSYSAIGNGGYTASTITELTGGQTQSFTGSDLNMYKQSIIGYINTKHIVVLDSNANTVDTTGYAGAKVGDRDLMANHALAITGYDGATGNLIVYNPWGSHSNGGGQSYNTSFEVSFAQLAALNDTLTVGSFVQTPESLIHPNNGTVLPYGFSALQYLAANPDLIKAFGTNQAAATSHYEMNGASEGRSYTFNGAEYEASNPDLIAAFGLNASSAIAHYVSNGYAEGRQTASFNAAAYLAANPDVARAGYTVDTAAQHYIAYGYTEHRALSHTLSAASLVDLAGVASAPGDNAQFL